MTPWNPDPNVLGQGHLAQAEGPGCSQSGFFCNILCGPSSAGQLPQQEQPWEGQVCPRGSSPHAGGQGKAAMGSHCPPSWWEQGMPVPLSPVPQALPGPLRGRGGFPVTQGPLRSPGSWVIYANSCTQTRGALKVSHTRLLLRATGD